MSANTVSTSVQSNKPVWYFIACWTILNAVQAYTLELHADEAYYWIYSRLLDWGYFDHPPMVAIFISIGDALFHNELGLRLITVLTSSVSLYLLWLIVRHYHVAPKWFIVIVSGFAIFNVYGFTTTPDAPLFLFTVLFYYCYRQYLHSDKWQIAVLLACITAGLLYSKYHGLLLVLFTVIANPQLFKRKSFYLIILLSAVLFAPHIWWQMQHNFPSLHYHLIDRSSSSYDFHHTTDYIPGQLLMAGPLIGWFLFYLAFKVKVKDAFVRCLIFNCAGTFLFFLASTFKGNVEPHWTLIAFVPLAMLVLINIGQGAYSPVWLFKLAVVNVALLLVLRFCIMAGVPALQNIGAVKSYYHFKEWAHLVKQKAGNAYVIMDEGFQNPSKYNFYNNTLKGFAYDSRYYRKTQYDIWPFEDRLQHKKIYYLLQSPLAGITTDSIKCAAGTWYGGWVDDTRTYQKIVIDTKVDNIKAKPSQKIQFDLGVTNPYPFAVSFANAGYKHPVVLEACFFTGNNLPYVQDVSAGFNTIALQKGQSKTFRATITAPLQKGEYSLLFSVRTEPFRGSKNSRIIKFTVE
jgi:hypothetical protein